MYVTYMGTQKAVRMLDDGGDTVGLIVSYR
jgi:hypothetical protein